MTNSSRISFYHSGSNVDLPRDDVITGHVISVLLHHLPLLSLFARLNSSDLEDFSRLRTSRKNMVSGSSLLVSDPFLFRSCALRCSNSPHQGVHSFRGENRSLVNEIRHL